MPGWLNNCNRRLGRIPIASKRNGEYAQRHPITAFWLEIDNASLRTEAAGQMT